MTLATDKASAPDLGMDAVEEFLRLRILWRGGTLTVLDARRVEGRLGFGQTRSGLMSEVLVDGRTVSLEPLGDLGTRRSFRNAEPGQTAEHVVRELDDFEFFVRIPAEEALNLTPQRLGIRIVEAVQPPLADEAEGLEWVSFGGRELRVRPVIAPDALLVGRLSPVASGLIITPEG